MAPCAAAPEKSAERVDFSQLAQRSARRAKHGCSSFAAVEMTNAMAR
jgi:hypothetical protein